MSRKLLVSIPLVEELKKLTSPMLLIDGREVLNPLPMTVDVTPRPPTLQEQIQRLLRVELAAQAKSQGYETFEESVDFDIEDDEEAILSGFEVKEMIEEEPVEDPGPIIDEESKLEPEPGQADEGDPEGPE